MVNSKKGLADMMSYSIDRQVVVITPEMKKKMGNKLVVTSENGNTIILNGGHHVKASDGAVLTHDDFNQRLKIGMQCIFSPKFRADGHMDLGGVR